MICWLPFDLNYTLQPADTSETAAFSVITQFNQQLCENEIITSYTIKILLYYFSLEIAAQAQSCASVTVKS